jgi:hypothetical protein
MVQVLHEAKTKRWFKYPISTNEAGALLPLPLICVILFPFLNPSICHRYLYFDFYGLPPFFIDAVVSMELEISTQFLVNVSGFSLSNVS